MSSSARKQKLNPQLAPYMGKLMVPLPKLLWPKSENLKDPPIEVWLSDFAMAQIYAPQEGGQRITVNRLQVERVRDNGEVIFKGGISWDRLQAIKHQIGFGDRWAVELYPPEDQVINVANMRHLFLTTTPDFGWKLKND